MRIVNDYCSEIKRFIGLDRIGSLGPRPLHVVAPLRAHPLVNDSLDSQSPKRERERELRQLSGSAGLRKKKKGLIAVKLRDKPFFPFLVSKRSSRSGGPYTEVTNARTTLPAPLI